MLLLSQKAFSDAKEFDKNSITYGSIFGNYLLSYFSSLSLNLFCHLKDKMNGFSVNSDNIDFCNISVKSELLTLLIRSYVSSMPMFFVDFYYLITFFSEDDECDRNNNNNNDDSDYIHKD